MTEEHKRNFELVEALKAVLCFELDNVRWMAENTCDEMKKAATLMRITDLLVHLEECRKAQDGSKLPESRAESVMGVNPAPPSIRGMENGNHDA